MTPLRFGAPPRALFGLHVPPAGEDRGHAALICNPFGQEAIRCQRMMRVLGERLARAGCHVLRFDYLGTGDSDGDDGQGDLEAWTGDVLRASEEMIRRSGCARASWFGLRLGGTLAALAAARAPRPPHRLVLWDPVVHGKAYLEELARLHAAEVANEASVVEPRSPAASTGEALGFPIGARLAAQLASLRPESFAATRAARVALLHASAAPGAAELRSELEASSVAVDASILDTEVVWASDEAMNTAIVPAEALAAIVAAIEGGA